ncbi:MAG: DUF4837 family protein [Candidatus Zhuqueibacterota bacterium]
MKSLLYFYALAATLAVLILSDCSRKPTALGSDYDIRVLADSTVWNQTEGPLRAIFEKVEYTPQKELVFTLLKGDVSNYKRFKNLIFLSTLESAGEISRSVNANLSASARAEINAGNIMFVQKGNWAQDQIVMFLIGKDINTLLARIDEQQSEIFNQFDNHWNAFHEQILYKHQDQVDVENHLIATYGWSIRVPADYKLDAQSAGDRFVMFHRPLPPRWFAVYWVEEADSTLINRDWCIQQRNRIGEKFYDREIVEVRWDDVQSEQVIFLNRRALKLKGLWKTPDNSTDPAGGPFRLYCFYDEKQKRIYFIDFHLFSPGLQRLKLHYLRQMEIIANTFRTRLDG